MTFSSYPKQLTCLVSLLTLSIASNTTVYADTTTTTPAAATATTTTPATKPVATKPAATKPAATKPATTKPAATKQPDPNLGVNAVNAKGEHIDTATTFTGGISVKKGALQNVATLNSSDATEVRGTITIDSKHVGKTVDLIVYVGFKPPSSGPTDKQMFFMLDNKSKIQSWDESPAHLASFKAIKKLPKTAQKVTLYKGKLPAGKLLISFGYRVKDPGQDDDNLVVTNGQPIDLTVSDNPTTPPITTPPTTTPPTTTPSTLVADNYTVLGFNDLGMHCMDSDFSVFSMLPPFNVLNAQVIERDSTGKPHLADDKNIEVRYSPVADAKGSINSTSLKKTNFWDHAKALFGKDFLPGQGLGGFYLPADTKDPQALHYNSSQQWFSAPGIPMTPIDDNLQVNPYPLLHVSAVDKKTGTTLVGTDVVIPVSQEFDCKGCHTTGQVATTKEPGITSWASDTNLDVQSKKNILMLHDYRIGTDLLKNTPVLCASCHYSAALDLSGQGVQGKQVGKPNMSQAIHQYHGFIDDQGTSMEETCYKCHPGKETQCLRGTMRNAGLECHECHGGMLTVGGKYPLQKGGSLDGKNDGNQRRPWQDLPRCQSCHTGDALDHLSGKDVTPAADGLRLFQAYKNGDDSASPILATNTRFAETSNSLYRNSKGHGGVACEGCHGSTHAEWAVLKPEANDNVTATQLQGHTGKLIECNTCHKGDSLPLTLAGPHGLHNVGDTKWVDRGSHKQFYQKDPNTCKACHGQNLEGTVLARVAIDRTFKVEGRDVNLKKDSQVSCDLCHGKPE